MEEKLWGTIAQQLARTYYPSTRRDINGLGQVERAIEKGYLTSSGQALKAGLVYYFYRRASIEILKIQRFLKSADAVLKACYYLSVRSAVRAIWSSYFRLTVWESRLPERHSASSLLAAGGGDV